MPGALSLDKKNTLIFVFSSVVFAPTTKTSKEEGRERGKEKRTVHAVYNFPSDNFVRLIFNYGQISCSFVKKKDN